MFHYVAVICVVQGAALIAVVVAPVVCLTVGNADYIAVIDY